MKGVYTSIRSSQLVMTVLAVVIGTLLVVGFAQATTTISTSITTGGNLTVTGNASTTIFSAYGPSYFGGSATTTIDTAGNIVGIGTAKIAGGTYASTTLQGATFTSYGLASSSSAVIGGGSTISNILFGFCTASVAVTASSTGYAACTTTLNVTSADKIFVMGTSSLPDRVTVIAASSTGTAGTIELQFANTGITGGTYSATTNSFNFIAIH